MTTDSTRPMLSRTIACATAILGFVLAVGCSKGREEQTSAGTFGELRTTEVDAGVKRLEENPTVNNAIVSAGLSPRDYFVMSIAIASAARAARSPAAALPTPTFQKNAEFIRGKTAELEHLRALREGMSVIEVKP